MKNTRLGVPIMGRPILAYVLVLVIALSVLVPSTAMANNGGPVSGYAIQPGYGQPGPGTQQYTVRAGDTLSSIALRFGTTTDSLMRANNIRHPDRIFVGQVLTVPRTGTGGSVGKGCQTEYTVHRGDTLSRIALRFGVDDYVLMRANNISNPNFIYVGQVLCIPGSSISKPVQPVQPIYPPQQPVKPVQPIYPPQQPVKPVQPIYPPQKPVHPVQPLPPSWPQHPPADPCGPSRPSGPDCQPDKEMDNWRAYYFSDKYFEHLVEERKDAEVRFNWYSEAPFEGMPNDRFSVRWDRAVFFEGGDYVFHSISDDGVRVFVDGNMIIDAWQIQPATENKATVSLSKGIHWIEVEYFEEAGDAQVTVYWEPKKCTGWCK